MPYHEYICAFGNSRFFQTFPFKEIFVMILSNYNALKLRRLLTSVNSSDFVFIWTVANIDGACMYHQPSGFKSSTHVCLSTLLYLILALTLRFSEFRFNGNNIHCSQIHHCLPSVFRLTFLYSHFNIESNYRHSQLQQWTIGNVDLEFLYSTFILQYCIYKLKLWNE